MTEKTPVLMVGNPGDLATRFLEGVKASSNFIPTSMNIKGRRGIVTLTGEKIKNQPIDSAYIEDHFNRTGVHLIPPAEHEATISTAQSMYPTVLAVNCANAEGFDVNFGLIKYRIPTLFAGTGVKPEQQERLAQEVIAQRGLYLPLTNMALPLVDLMDFTKRYAQANPKALESCVVEVNEMHQQPKADASGTGKAFAEYFRLMGAYVDLTQVNQFKHDGTARDYVLDMGNGSRFKVIRNPETMVANGVKPEDTKGLGWHRYKLTTMKSGKEAEKQMADFYHALKHDFFTGNPLLNFFHVRFVGNSYCTAASPDGNLVLHMTLNGGGKEFELMHNITGRQPYVNGGLQTLPFLLAMAEAGEAGKVLSGGDVLGYLRKK